MSRPEQFSRPHPVSWQGNTLGERGWGADVLPSPVRHWVAVSLFVGAITGAAVAAVYGYVGWVIRQTNGLDDWQQP